jgi:hypothetical protein
MSIQDPTLTPAPLPEGEGFKPLLPSAAFMFYLFMLLFVSFRLRGESFDDSPLVFLLTIFFVFFVSSWWIF